MCHICYSHEYSTDFGNNQNDPLNTELIDQPTIDKIIASMNGSSWGGAAAASSTTQISYTFDYLWQGGQGNSPKKLSNADQESMRDMFDIYQSVANVEFTEKTDGSKASISIRNIEIPGGVGGYANLPNAGGAGVSIDTLNGALGPGGTGGFAWFAAIHELGHAMGMYHPFDQGTPLPSAEQTAGYTVMAYRDGGGYSRGETTGLGIYDIALLQHKYGKNMDHNSGDTVYEYGTEVKGEALWDGGGNDTIKVADGFTGNATINLNDGDHLNTIGRAKIKIAYDAEIENAIGGRGEDNIRGNELDNYLYGGDGEDIVHGDAGDDVIFGGEDQADADDGDDVLLGGTGDDIVFGNGGNDVLIGDDGYTYTGAEAGDDVLFGGLGDDAIYGNAGDDELIGAAGNDSLYGGVGDDTYVVGWGNDVDLIYGFEGAGQAGGDVIRILVDANNNGIDDFDSLMQSASDDGTHTEFDLGGGNSILVANHTTGDFDADDFDFV